MNQTPEQTIQVTLLQLEFLCPEKFKNVVYDIVTKEYNNTSIDEIYKVANDSMDYLTSKGIILKPESIIKAIQEDSSEDFSLLAVLTASIVKAAMLASQINKPLSWWVDTTKQLIDISYPKNTTQH